MAFPNTEGGLLAHDLITPGRCQHRFFTVLIPRSIVYQTTVSETRGRTYWFSPDKIICAGSTLWKSSAIIISFLKMEGKVSDQYVCLNWYIYSHEALKYRNWGWATKFVWRGRHTHTHAHTAPVCPVTIYTEESQSVEEERCVNAEARCLYDTGWKAVMQMKRGDTPLTEGILCASPAHHTCLVSFDLQETRFGMCRVWARWIAEATVRCSVENSGRGLRWPRWPHLSVSWSLLGLAAWNTHGQREWAFSGASRGLEERMHIECVFTVLH